MCQNVFRSYMEKLVEDGPIRIEEFRHAILYEIYELEVSVISYAYSKQVISLWNPISVV